MKALALALAFLLCPTFVWGEEPTPALVSSATLTMGQPAPFAGILIPESQIDLIVAGRVNLAECTGRLDASERVRADLADELAAASSRAATVSPSSSPWPWIAVGFVVGVVAAGAAVWGAANLVNASD